MADVSPWLVVFSTLASGGFAMSANLFDPVKDRRARAAADKKARRDLLLEKNEQLYGELSEAMAWLNHTLSNERKRIFGQDDDGLLNGHVFHVLAKSHALVATYFPAAMPIVEENRARLGPIMTDWIQKVNAGFADANAEKAARSFTSAQLIGAQTLGAGNLTAYFLVHSGTILDS